MTRKCSECGGDLCVTHQDYRYVECGLQNVTLKNLLVYACDACDAQAPEIPNIGGLHRAIAMDLLKKKTLLCGEEIRFLRKMARMTGLELAKLMGVTSTQLSKWENNKRSIGAPSDRVLRLICYAGVLERIVNIGADLKAEMAKMAMFTPSLNIRELLSQIEGKSKGPKRVTIDASTISGMEGPPFLPGPHEHARIQ